MPFLSPNAKAHMAGLRKEGLIVKRDTNIKHRNNSPLYYTLRLILIVYAIVFILSIFYNAIDLFFCYLQAPIHSVRIRNTSLPTETPGFLFNISTYNTSHESPHYLSSYIPNVKVAVIEPYGLTRGQNINSTEDRQNYQINIDTNASQRQILGAFPMAIVINSTNGVNSVDNICMSSLWFGSFARSSIRPTDGGTAANLDIVNPNRKRIWITSMWYNFGYWISTNSIYIDNRFTEEQKKIHNIPNLTDVPKTSYYCTKQISDILPSQYNKSNVPVWFMNFSDASMSRLNGLLCTQNYGLIFNLSTWFCISPLLIYDLRLSSIEFVNVTLTGNFIFDFRTDEVSLVESNNIFSCFTEKERVLPYTFTMHNSSVNLVTLTKNIKTLQIESFGQSNITFTLPQRVLTCTKGNISLDAPVMNDTIPCRLEFSGISGESYYSGDSHRYYSTRYIAPLDRIEKLTIIIKLHVIEGLVLKFPFCDSNTTPSFPLKVIDSRSNVIFMLDYVPGASITFTSSNNSQTTKSFKGAVQCATEEFTLTLSAQ